MLVVLDATVELPKPRHDGDNRAESGREGWLHSHIPGSRHADLLGELSVPGTPRHFTLPTPERQLASLDALGLRSESRIVIYDRGKGIWAARLWWMLRALGIAASVLDGGWSAWQEEGRGDAQGGAIFRSPDTGTVLTGAQARPELWTGRAAVEDILAERRPGTLICALGSPSFRGEVPTRYARRGHIPGSRNLPYGDLVDARGRYLPPAALRERLAQALAPATSDGLVLYCGGGISACALALGLTLAGREDLSVYAGSLDEWSSDPALPLVTGP
jgi:thiosulfate/3-mercaptopyruvate sulfurtransferase